MSRLGVFLIFAVAMVFIIEINAQRCGRNKVWDWCGSACPPACFRYTGPCHRRCVRGCFCRPGWFRTSTGTCVERC